MFRNVFQPMESRSSTCIELDYGVTGCAVSSRQSVTAFLPRKLVSVATGGWVKESRHTAKREQCLSLDPDGAPIRLLLGKTNGVESGRIQHLLYLMSRETLLQPGAKPVIGVSAHHVEFSMTIERQWY